MKIALDRTDGRSIWFCSPGIETAAYFLVLAGLLLWAYAPAWHIAPHADDLMLMLGAQRGLFGGAYEGGFLFRPLELLVIEFGDWLHGNPQVAKVVNFVGLLAATAILFRVAQRVQLTARALPFMVAALFACHPVNVATISQVDTVSQQLATVAVLGAFAWYLLGPRDRPALYHIAGSGLLMLALLSKEVTVGAVFALPLALAVADLLERRAPLGLLLRRTILMMLAVAGLFLIYLALRAWAGALLVAGDHMQKYAMSSQPLLVLRNMALLLGAVAYLGSSLDIFLRDGPGIVPVVFTGMFHALALLGGLVVLHELRAKSADPREVAVVAAASIMLIASLFPSSFTGWPSEVYSFLPLPFYILIMSFFALRGWQTLVRRWRLPLQPAAALGLAAVLVCCAWMLAGVREKLSYSAAVSERSEAFLAQLDQWYAQTTAVARVPTACVVHPDGVAADDRVYSTFAMSDYSLLHPIVHWLNHRYGPRLHLPFSPAVYESCEVVIEVSRERLRLRPTRHEGRGASAAPRRGRNGRTGERLHGQVPTSDRVHRADQRGGAYHAEEGHDDTGHVRVHARRSGGGRTADCA